MSYAREGLRTLIRTLAFPSMLVYVLYKMWIQAKDKPGVKKLVGTYRKLVEWFKKSRGRHLDEETIIEI